MIEFARPSVLLLLPLILLWAFLRRSRPVVLPQFLAGLERSKRRWFGPSPVRTALRLGTLCVLTLALAGPESWTVRTLEEEGIALVMALDLSGSMVQADPGGGTRLAVAQREITRFVGSRPTDIIGLVTFGEHAITRVPPTTDHNHLLSALGALAVGSSEEGTALGMGVGLAAYITQGVELPSRVVVVLSDGRNNRGNVDPVSAAEAGRALGVTVHAVGLGTRDGPDPRDETTLRAVARAGGGRFYRAEDAQGLGRVLDEIRGMEQSPHPDRQIRSATALHAPLLWAGWVMLLLEMLAAGLPWRRTK